MNPATVVLVLALLLGMHPVATNLYLPTLPQLKSELGASMAATQLTLSALVLSFGIGQMLWGPLADRFGRRPVLLTGLSLYTVAGVLSIPASDVTSLIAYRSLQGLGMAAAIVCARAMVRDLFEPREGVRMLSQGLSWMGFIALLCPLVGAALAEVSGFRAALAILTLFGAAALWLVALKVDETMPYRNLSATRPGPLLATWWRILRHPTFIAYTGLTASTYAGLFTFLSSSSFVLIEGLKLSPLGYSAVLSTSALFYLLGTFGCRYWLRRHGILGTVRRAGVLSLLGGVSMAGLSLAGVYSIWAIVLPQCVYVFAHGVHQSCGQAAAVGPFPAHAGAAAALSGFLLSLVSFVIGGCLGLFMDGSVYPLTLSVGAWSMLTALIAWTWVQKHGEFAAASPGLLQPARV